MIALDDPPVWTRTEAIARLREGLLALCDDEHSMCEVAASRGIFCRGFQRWHEAEFHSKWRTALGQSTHLTRAQLESLANIWQLAEQIRCRVALACDAPASAGAPCRGWDEFSDYTLARYCGEILGRYVVVAPRPAREVSYKNFVETNRQRSGGMVPAALPRNARTEPR